MAELIEMRDGKRVASLIRGSRHYGEALLLMSIDTRSNSESEFLYDLCDRVFNSPIEVPSSALCDALEDVYEVWVLDFTWVADPDCGLLIEDGTIFENTL